MDHYALIEQFRLSALAEYQALDPFPTEPLNELAFLASLACGAPFAQINLVDESRQWTQASYGLHAMQLGRDEAFCALGLYQPDELVVIADAKADGRTARFDVVGNEPRVRFYAGAPLITADGYVLGALCVMDQIPRTLGPTQTAALRALAAQAMLVLEGRRTLAKLDATERALEESRQRLAEIRPLDRVTGLPNNDALTERLVDEIKRAERLGQSLTCVLVQIDALDEFKRDYGDAATEELVVSVARALGGSLRTHDFMAAIGEATFGLLLPATDGPGASMLVDRFQQIVQGSRMLTRAVTASVGAAVSTIRPFPTDAAQSAPGLIRQASVALAEARALGRGHIVFSASELAGDAPSWLPFKSQHLQG